MKSIRITEPGPGTEHDAIPEPRVEQRTLVVNDLAGQSHEPYSADDPLATVRILAEKQRQQRFAITMLMSAFAAMFLLWSLRTIAILPRALRAVSVAARRAALPPHRR